MQSVFNTTARQFNIKSINKAGNVTTMRIIPGLNAIDDVAMKVFEKDKYFIRLQTEGALEMSTPRVDNMELTEEPHVVETKVKTVPRRNEK